MHIDDTIAAIATPPGIGGIGIVRISGPQSEAIARTVYRPPKGDIPLNSHHLYRGQIISSQTGTIIDEVLITLMRKPHSYTGEDQLEIHGHGNPLILEAVLAEVIRAGARPAQPGEFTRRAFLNNRIDLTQAEALMGLMTARTPRGLEIAHTQLQGALQRQIETFRQALIEILATLETVIDFSEDEGKNHYLTDAGQQIQSVSDQIRKILSTYHEGKMIRHGVHAMIIGRPNVGKSSLLNRLLGEHRAIVTAIPGTTRDFIEESADIHGIAVNLTDTAGLRNPADIIEKEGIDRVWEKLSAADLVIPVLDGSMPLTDEDYEILEKISHQSVLLVINKADLDHLFSDEDFQAWLPDVKPVRISAKTGIGIPALKEAVYQRLVGTQTDHSTDIIITQLRHKTTLEKTIGCLLQAHENLANAMSPEFIALDLREALDSLGEIVGITATEDILDRIFSTFCIGK